MDGTSADYTDAKKTKSQKSHSDDRRWLLENERTMTGTNVHPQSFPDGSEVKNSANARDPVLILGSGRSPGEGNGNPLQYSCLGNPMDRGAW